jgi:hypothetical protein
MDTPEAHALFISTDGYLYPDYLICGGLVPIERQGRVCPFSDQGRMPLPVPITPDDNDLLARGKPGDYCPPCATHQLASLGHWQSHKAQDFPPALLPLRLFRCRQGYWLVVPGLKHQDATRLLWQVTPSAPPVTPGAEPVPPDSPSAPPDAQPVPPDVLPVTRDQQPAAPDASPPVPSPTAPASGSSPSAGDTLPFTLDTPGSTPGAPPPPDAHPIPPDALPPASDAPLTLPDAPPPIPNPPPGEPGTE